MSFWLRHKTNAAATWTQVEFEGLSNYPKREVTRINGETLRTNLTSHIKSKRGTWAVIISADETSAHASFLQDFWEAELQQISFEVAPDNAVDGDGILVITEGGTEPVEFIEGLVDLKEYSFTLRQVTGA
jgi:hypothetical protein